MGIDPIPGSGTTEMPDSPLSDRLRALAATWASSQQRLVLLSAELAESSEWILAGSRTAAHHLAALADIEVATAREWIRVGKRVRGLPRVAQRFENGSLSYSKVRALLPVATPSNEAELLEIADRTPAADLRVELAKWLKATLDPEELAAYHHGRRSVSWRTESDGMVAFVLRLPPAIAARLITLLGVLLMRSRPRPDDAGWPSLPQQRADAFEQLLDSGGSTRAEVIFHVRGDGCTTDNGTPVPDSVMAGLIDGARLRAMVHDAEGRPINASRLHRHPTDRQKRVVKERDRCCCDCGATELLEYDHDPPYEESGQTVVDELRLLCAPCHQRRHEAGEQSS